MFYDTRKVLIIGGVVVLLLGIGAFFLLRGGSGADPVSVDSVSVMSEAERTRLNRLSLAQDYYERGEYQRALDILVFRNIFLANISGHKQ